MPKEIKYILRNGFFYFLLILFIYPLYLILKMPSWYLSGNFWDEAATNYFFKAAYEPWYVAIVSTDAGYIPLPQRLIALGADALQFPPESVPWFYTFIAVLSSACLIGAFTLPFFRTIVKSDSLRFVIAIAVLSIADFMTRGFVNFTYFAAFFIVATSLVLLKKPKSNVPIFIWIIPIMFLSKPAILILLPLVLLASIRAGLKFRLIGLVSLLFGSVQIWKMTHSLSVGTATAFSGNEMSTSDKITSSLLHGFGQIGGYLLGPNFNLGAIGDVWVGIFLTLISTGYLFWKKSFNAVTVLVGAYIVVANATLHTFTMPIEWQLDLSRLTNLHQDRHTIVGYTGFIFVVVGLISELVIQIRSIKIGRFSKTIPTLLFLAWFGASGWLSTGISLSNVPGIPMTGIGKWQEDAAVVRSNPDKACVPIDPLGIVFGLNCVSLNPIYNSLTPVTISQEAIQKMSISVPDAVKGRELDSIGIILSPSTSGGTIVSVEGSAISQDGGRLIFSGTQLLTSAGELIQIFVVNGRQLIDFETISLNFSVPVKLGKYADSETPIVLWMGSP